MFSGIVEEVGVLSRVEESGDGQRLRISASSVLEDAELGESISVSGCCLTVIEFSKDWFDVEATFETLRCTTLRERKEGDSVNLEKALKVSDRLGGHIVSGHVDCVGRVLDITEEGFSKVIRFGIPLKWAPYFVKKGSVTVEGVYLTVVDIGEEKNPAVKITENSPGEESDSCFWFSVALIPHTMDVTTLGRLSVGSGVNVETDIIARYVVRLLGEGYTENLNKQRGSLLSGADQG